MLHRQIVPIRAIGQELAAADVGGQEEVDVVRQGAAVVRVGRSGRKEGLEAVEVDEPRRARADAARNCSREAISTT
jgi:hypothetical protein